MHLAIYNFATHDQHILQLISSQFMLNLFHHCLAHPCFTLLCYRHTSLHMARHLMKVTNLCLVFDAHQTATRNNHRRFHSQVLKTDRLIHPSRDMAPTIFWGGAFTHKRLGLFGEDGLCLYTLSDQSFPCILSDFFCCCCCLSLLFAFCNTLAPWPLHSYDTKSVTTF